MRNSRPFYGLKNKLRSQMFTCCAGVSTAKYESLTSHLSSLSVDRYTVPMTARS